MFSINSKFNVKFFILAIIWAAMIYYFSSIPDLRSNFSGIVDLVLRKIAHIFVYMVLTYLLAKAMPKHTRIYVLIVIVAAICYAWSDEFHQLSVLGRSGSPRDILIDAIGVFFGILVYRWFKNNKQKTSR